MKRILIYVMLVAVLAAGCSADKTEAAKPAASDARPSASAAAPIDFDLTKMSGTMVYSYVYNLLNEPLDYVGKRFKIAGSYDEFVWDENGATYHNIIVADATACCSEGLEFVMLNESAEYPKPGTEIVVVGTLESYDENGEMYLHVVCDEMNTVSK